MKINRVVQVLVIGIFLFVKVNAQDSTKVLLGKYLVHINELDSAIFSSKKVKGKIEIITNYYVDSISSLKIRTIELLLYRFGSFSEHTRPHFALLKKYNIRDNCIIDCNDISKDLNKIISFLNQYPGSFNESENIKLKVIKKIVENYPVHYPSPVIK